MKTTLHLENAHSQALPAAFQEDDVRYPESLVEHFLQEYTRPGDTVLDPFAGFGTTLMVAERLRRIPFGIEINLEKVSYVRSKMKPGGIVVLEIVNIKRNGRVTTLGCGQEISQVLRFEGEVAVCWDQYGYGYDHSYCLVYSAL